MGTWAVRLFLVEIWFSIFEELVVDLDDSKVALFLYPACSKSIYVIVHCEE